MFPFDALPDEPDPPEDEIIGIMPIFVTSVPFEHAETAAITAARKPNFKPFMCLSNLLNIAGACLEIRR
ncbi:MAG TPA: hypothetical protein VGI65_18085 [Steroidobacteraceae bacterium]|jgi:hypothetical protein